MRLFAILSVLLLSAIASAEEQRCTELGAQCICSEPLNYDAGEYFEAFNPPDTTGATQCAGGTCIDAEPTGWTSVSSVEGHADLDFPNGYSGFVQRMRTKTGFSDGDFGWWLNGTAASGLENETICQRHYFRCDPDLPVMGVDQRFKSTQFAFNGWLTQSQMAHDGSSRSWDLFGDQNCTGSVGGDWLSACQQGWVRVEHCHDIGSGAGIRPKYRVRLTSLEGIETERTRVCETANTLSTPAATVGANGFSADLFLQTLGNSAYKDMDRYVSHFMTARVPYDENFWIGAAAELEENLTSRPCTDQVDCYADCVNDGSTAECLLKYGRDITDPNLLFVEDWEASTLHEECMPGCDNAGPPLYGDWNAQGGGATAGFNSYFRNVLQPGNGPKAPTCGNSVSDWHRPWTADNRWGAATQEASCLRILRDGEFEEEGAFMGTPDIPAGGEGVLDGYQTFAARTPIDETLGPDGSAGTMGKGVWSATGSYSITQALAYSDNVETSGILRLPSVGWKHDEWTAGPDPDPNRGDHWNLGFTGVGTPQSYPYAGFVFTEVDQATCNSVLGAANIIAGQWSCASSGNLLLGADAAVYDQATDFPWGTWACHQAQWQNRGTSNTTLKIWHNQELLLHITNWDTSGGFLTDEQTTSMFLNNYSNANQDDQVLGTTQPTYRFQDNIHVTGGDPVPCDQIGFTNLAPPDPDIPTPELIGVSMQGVTVE